MPDLLPIVTADAAPIPSVYGFKLTNLVSWHAFADDMSAESQTGNDTARWIEPTGDMEGLHTYGLQDTYLSGTPSRSGRAMTAVAGSWKDDQVSPWADKYCLFQPDSALAYWEAIDAAPGAKLGHNLVVLRMGLAPAGVAHTAANTYAALELASGFAPNYRVAFEWGKPIRIDADPQGTGAWINGIAIARKLGSVENYLAHNGGEIRLHIRPDYARGQLHIEVGDGQWLRAVVARPFAPANPQQTGTLPAGENYRYYGARRWTSIEVHPMTFGAPTVTKSLRYFGNDVLANLPGALVTHNTAGYSDSAQQVALTPILDGQGSMGYTATVTNADPATPPRFRDILIVIPATWATSAPGVPLPLTRLDSVLLRYLEVWDDAARMGMASGRLVVNNRGSIYTGAFGNYACRLMAGSGLSYGKLMEGVIGCDPEGIAIHRFDPWRWAEFPVRDKFATMDVPIEEEIIFDGWCIYTAVAYLAQKGNIHPAFMTFPNTPLPPPGGYGDNFPYYILPKGSGNRPAVSFGPERTALSCLAELIQHSGEVNPFTGISAPHYMWFDQDGYFYFKPYDPRQYPVVKFYSTNGPGDSQIVDGTFSVHNSIAQMRTHVTLQTQDAITYELLQFNLPLPGNYGAVGFRMAAFQRSSEWGTPAYLVKLAQIAAIQASLPTQIVRFKAPFCDYVRAGMTIGVAEDKTLGRVGLFTVLERDVTLGSVNHTGNDGRMACEMWITARSVESAIPFA